MTPSPQDEQARTLTERDHAMTLANRVLDKPYIDPDGDICLLARQFQRETERSARLAAEVERLKELLDGANKRRMELATQLTAEREARERAERALYELTPGGSEYAGDIPACVRYVRDVRDSQLRTITSFKRERDAERKRAEAAEKRIAAALDFLEDYEDVRDGSDGRQMPNTYMEVGMILRGEGPG
jgi:chromosome segregation ATPase